MSEDNFQSWVNQVVVNKEAKPLSTGEVVKSSSGQSFGAVEFIKIEKKDFTAEVGRKGDFYIYHFYPSQKWLGGIAVFHKQMTKAFKDIFKDNGEVEADWVEEMLSWAVRVSGWTSHVWGDELALRVIEVVQMELDEWESRYDASGNRIK